jgi:hypothetical protein
LSVKYVICEGICNFDTNKYFDLVGETEHMLEFSESIDFLKLKNLVNHNTTVARVLRFLTEKVKGFITMQFVYTASNLYLNIKMNIINTFSDLFLKFQNLNI